jgi:hypothetical protein
MLSRARHRCEPYLVASRQLLPWHDSRVRGLWSDSQSWVAHVASDGFKFKVLHDSFMLHR